jgi:hypothetical protein
MGRLGAVLTAAGIAVWGIGVVAWVLGVWVTMPPDTVRVLVLALAVLTGGLLLAAGAMVGRDAKARDEAGLVGPAQAAPQLLTPPSIGTTPRTSQPPGRTAPYDERVT